MESAKSVSKGSENLQTSLSVGLYAARVLAASGQASDLGHASELLEAVLAEALKTGLITQQLETRLALGESK